MPSNPSDPETPCCDHECHEGEHGECGVDSNGVVCMPCWSVVKEQRDGALAENQRLREENEKLRSRVGK